MPLTPIASAHESLAVAGTAVATTNGTASGSAANASYAIGQVLSAPVRYTRDGSTPTASVGTQAVAGAFIRLRSREEVRGFKAIRETSTSATIEFDYFSGEVGPDDRQQDNPIQVSASLAYADGTVAVPSQSFASDTDSGRYRIGANNIGDAVNGAKVLDIGTTGLAVTGLVSATTSILSTGATSGVGYATGAGGAVTQGTSITTGVTLDKACGTITTFAAAAVAGAEDGPFTVTCAAVAATDVVVVSIKSYAGTGTPQVYVSAVAAGSFAVTITNLHGATALNAAIVFNFAVVKGVAA